MACVHKLFFCSTWEETYGKMESSACRGTRLSAFDELAHAKHYGTMIDFFYEFKFNSSIGLIFTMD